MACSYDSSTGFGDGANAGAATAPRRALSLPLLAPFTLGPATLDVLGAVAIRSAAERTGLVQVEPQAPAPVGVTRGSFRSLERTPQLGGTLASGRPFALANP